MLFNSYEFIFGFLPVTVTGFWLLVQCVGCTAATGWLILASIVFYLSVTMDGLSIIIPSIVFDFLIAKAILRTDLAGERQRRFLFTAGVVVNVLFLGYFKYRNFFVDTTNSVFATHFPLKQVILPLGISFLTFQKIAFLADVQSGEIKAVGFLEFLFFTLFFPRTIAGPIVHYQEIIPQVARVTTHNLLTNVAVGIGLFSLGLFKKAVIADSVAQFVPSVFDRPFDPALSDQPPTLLAAWTGILAYTFQLYFDFSGYSDMALGAARLFGVRLPMNFNSPLKASSIVEFWGRWHITLTRFLTAYIYTPIVLQLTRARMARGKPVLRGKSSTLPPIAVLVALPTFITMTISGLWHGAGWQFIIWGVLHGVYLTINQSWRILRPRLWPDVASYESVMKPLGTVLTFSAVVIALVFFRATSVRAAFSILGGMAGINGVLPHDVQLLENLGIRVPWPMLGLPFAAFGWILMLLLAVILLPNSLEFLRRFQPALDFPPEADHAITPKVTRPVTQLYGMASPSATMKLRSMRAAVWLRCDRGISLTGLTAAIAALLGVLGLMALTSGGAFVYGQF
jgi:alginate O-acetyltransferase complex protein AlgI